MSPIPDIKRELLKLVQLAKRRDDDGIVRTIEMLDVMPADAQSRTVDRLRRYLASCIPPEVEGHPFLPDPPPLDGELLLGTTSTGSPVSLSLRDLLIHLLISAPTRKGKSMFVLNIVVQLVGLGIPVHIFDTKGEYADLLAAMCPDVLVIPFRDMRLNVFSPPANVPLQEWVMDLMANYFRESLYYRDGVINLYRDICQALVAAQTSLNPQTFTQAFNRTKAKSKSFRYIDYYESLKRFVSTLERPTFWCESGFDMNTLARQSVVYDLSNTGNDLRLFFIMAVVTWFQAAREYQRNRGVELVLVFDELSNFITEEAAKRADRGEPFILDMVRRSRAKGIPVIIADQTYTTFHTTIRTNCQTKVILETADAPSCVEVGRDLGLSEEQRAFLRVMSQEKRRAVVQLPTWPEPILFDVPEVQVPPAQPRRPLNLAWTPIHAPVKTEPKVAAVTEPTHEMEDYLACCARSWFKKETAHDREANVNARKGNVLRQRLLQIGLLKEHVLHTGAEGGPWKLAVPTKAGYHYMKSRGIPFTIPPGNGSPQHRWWQRTISLSALLRGYQVEIEFSLTPGGKRVDVGAMSVHEKVAYEVVMTDPFENEVQNNLRKDLDEGWDRVCFCVETDDIREELTKRIGEADLPEAAGRFEIRLLRTFR